MLIPKLKEELLMLSSSSEDSTPGLMPLSKEETVTISLRTPEWSYEIPVKNTQTSCNCELFSKLKHPFFNFCF